MPEEHSPVQGQELVVVLGVKREPESFDHPLLGHAVFGGYVGDENQDFVAVFFIERVQSDDQKR